jgi:hypothetical protein
MAEIQKHIDRVLSESIDAKNIASVIELFMKAVGQEIRDEQGGAEHSAVKPSAHIRDAELRDTLRGAQISLEKLLNGTVQISVDPQTSQDNRFDYVSNLLVKSIEQYMTTHPHVTDELYDTAMQHQDPTKPNSVCVFSKDPRVSAVFWYLYDTIDDAGYIQRITNSFVNQNDLKTPEDRS